jgi:hypothetical protein
MLGIVSQVLRDCPPRIDSPSACRIHSGAAVVPGFMRVQVVSGVHHAVVENANRLKKSRFRGLALPVAEAWLRTTARSLP